MFSQNPERQIMKPWLNMALLVMLTVLMRAGYADALKPVSSCLRLGYAFARQLYPHPSKLEVGGQDDRMYSSGDKKVYYPFAQCRVMPGDPGRLIVMLPVRKSWKMDPNDIESPDCCDVDVIVAEAASKKILAVRHNLVTNTLSSDALSDWKVYGVRLSPESYALAEGVNAFGVYIAYTSRGSHKYTDMPESLNLYVFDGRKIELVLKDLEAFHDNGMNWFSDSMPCPPVQSRLQRVISVGSESNHGYVDLKVHQSVLKVPNDYGEETDHPDCGKPHVVGDRDFVLHFNGKQYVLAKKYRIFVQRFSP